MAIWDVIAGPILDIINKVVPDKGKQAELQLELAKLAQSEQFKQIDAELARNLAQTDINKIEAQSELWWKAGWRPAIGWVGAMALFTYYVPYCLVATGIWAYQVVHTGTMVPRPDLGITDLLGLIGGLLGFGYMRSYDKKNGTV